MKQGVFTRPGSRPEKLRRSKCFPLLPRKPTWPSRAATSESRTSCRHTEATRDQANNEQESGCAWAALPDCNAGIVAASSAPMNICYGEEYGHEDRPDPACGHERPHAAGEARLFARRHGHGPG